MTWPSPPSTMHCTHSHAHARTHIHAHTQMHSANHSASVAASERVNVQGMWHVAWAYGAWGSLALHGEQGLLLAWPVAHLRASQGCPTAYLRASRGCPTLCSAVPGHTSTAEPTRPTGPGTHLSRQCTPPPMRMPSDACVSSPRLAHPPTQPSIHIHTHQYTHACVLPSIHALNPRSLTRPSEGGPRRPPLRCVLALLWAAVLMSWGAMRWPPPGALCTNGLWALGGSVQGQASVGSLALTRTRPRVPPSLCPASAQEHGEVVVRRV